MPWKTVATFVTDLNRDAASVDAALALAQRAGGHLDILCLGIDPTQPEVYYTGAQAVALPGAMEEAARQAEALEAGLRDRLSGEDARWSLRSVAAPMVGVTAAVTDAARFCDVVVAAPPHAPGRCGIDVAIVEAALFGAAAPVLVVPDRGLPAAFRRIALAWNDSSEALRAARAALPAMQAAGATDIVTVDPPRQGSADPALRLAQMLSRHGVRVEVRALPRALPRAQTATAETLARHVADSGSDLLVMGAYGHSRLREAILGGTTRAMLEHVPVPVLMMH